VRPVTGGQHLAAHPATTGLRLAEGSWGVNGDHSMWMNVQTRWTWDRLWPLEDAFWDAAPAALAIPGAHAILAQAARELLLAQASDWQFIISTGAVADYAERRFIGHCEDTRRLLDGLRAGALEGAARLAEELWLRDSVFPDVLDAVSAAISAPEKSAPCLSPYASAPNRAKRRQGDSSDPPPRYIFHPTADAAATASHSRQQTSVGTAGADIFGRIATAHFQSIPETL